MDENLIKMMMVASKNMRAANKPDIADAIDKIIKNEIPDFDFYLMMVVNDYLNSINEFDLATEFYDTGNDILDNKVMPIEKSKSTKGITLSISKVEAIQKALEDFHDSVASWNIGTIDDMSSDQDKEDVAYDLEVEGLKIFLRNKVKKAKKKK